MRSSRFTTHSAMTWPGSTLGENCFVYENVVVKPFAQLGRDVIVETGSVVGHHTEIHDHCFLGPHSVVLGECTIEPFCIIGANAIVRERVRIASGCIIGAGALITRDTRNAGVYLALDRPAIGGRDNLVRRNVVRDSGKDAFLVRSEDRDSSLKRNVAVGAGDDGFDIQSHTAKLTKNLALQNGDLGIAAVRSVIDGGGNQASGNGDPRQCTNIACS